MKFLEPDTTVNITWTSKVCNVVAVGAVFRGFGPVLYILLGSRYG